MDDGPFRTPQPAGRRTDNEPESIDGQDGQPKQHHVESKPVHRSITRNSFNEKKSNKKLYVAVAAVIIVIAVCAIGFFAFSKLAQSGAAIDGGKYQAVFFTNGQVYFGKLQQFNSEYMKLTDVYYLQTQSEDTSNDSKNPQETSGDQNNATLIKLGDEIHGPEDQMVISKDQILFYENLKKDGKVSQSIEKFKNPN